MNAHTPRLIPAVLAAALLLSGCSLLTDPSGSSAVTADSLQATAWRLYGFSEGGGGLHTLDDDDVYTLSFDTDTTLGGRARCNDYGAEYTARSGSFSTGRIWSTLALCDGESRIPHYFNVLEAIRRYELDHATLRLIAETGTTLVYRPAER